MIENIAPSLHTFLSSKVRIVGFASFAASDNLVVGKAIKGISV